jgi:hypothetical protein
VNTAEVFANVASTTVSSGGTDAPVSGTVETWTVASSTGFPAASATAVPATQFHVSDPDFPSEQIAVTSVSGTTWTVTRGSESTTPVQHASGFTVYAVTTAGGLEAFAVPINGGSRFLPAISVPPPSGDTSGATDTAAIQAIENAADSAGGILLFSPGTYYVTGLTKQAYTIWQGSGRLSTTIMLASGADTDVVQGAAFTSLTLSGSTTGGIGGWGIRDLTIDGNKSNQTGTSYGLRVYGYNFDVPNVSIRNCLTDGLYTEWGDFGNPGPDQSMEARFYGLKIHGCGGNGWHNRGPHDSRAFDVTIFGNGSGAYNYWSESCGSGTTVASGSNTVNVATFTGSGVLNVATTLGFPTASISSTQGSLTVATSGGSAVITYTGTSATTFTGCTTVSGSGTLSTGGSVAATGGGYSANGYLLYGVHCYGSTAAYQYVLDAQNQLYGCVGEVATTASVLLRSDNCIIEGGLYFIVSGASQTGCGIQLGDTTNGIFGEYIRTYLSNFACSSAATAGLNFVNDKGQNDIDVGVYAPTGTVIYGGSPNGASTSYKIRAYGQTTAINQAASLWRDRAPFFMNVPGTVSSAYNITVNGTDVFNVNSAASRIEYPNAYTHRWYSGNYTGQIGQLDGSGNFSAAGNLSMPGIIVPWAASTTYTAGQLISYYGCVYQASTNVTTGSTFSFTDLNLVSAPIAGNALPSGQYIFAGGGQSPSTSNTLGIGTLRVFPWYLPNAGTLTAIGAEITSAGDSGGGYRLGVYADTGAFGPGALLVDAGTINANSATVQAITISLPAGPAILWAGGAVQNVVTTQPTVRTFTTGPFSLVLPSQPGAGISMAGWTNASTISGALPGTFSVGSTVGSVPRIFFKG